MINEVTERVIEPGEFTVSEGGKQPCFKGQFDEKTTGDVSATFTVSGEFKFADL